MTTCVLLWKYNYTSRILHRFLWNGRFLCWADGRALQQECQCMRITKISHLQFLEWGEDAQSYTFLFEHNGKSIYGITLSDDYICFA